MPEGGIGKEGPSAGTALLSAFVSLFTKTKVDPNFGEFFLFRKALSLPLITVLRQYFSFDRRNHASWTSLAGRWP